MSVPLRAGALYAWFSQGGRLLVKIPEDETAVSYREKLTRADEIDHGFMGWVELEDGSLANMGQILRLEVIE